MKLTLTVKSTPRPTSDKMLKHLLIEAACKAVPPSVFASLRDTGRAVFEQPEWGEIEYAFEDD
jgi:hypothetical protein